MTLREVPAMFAPPVRTEREAPHGGFWPFV